MEELETSRTGLVNGQMHFYENSNSVPTSNWIYDRHGRLQIVHGQMRKGVTCNSTISDISRERGEERFGTPERQHGPMDRALLGVNIFGLNPLLEIACLQVRIQYNAHSQTHIPQEIRFGARPLRIASPTMPGLLIRPESK